MKALSVKQPYASQIANGVKTREFRSWKVAHRGPLLICASANPKIGGLPAGALVCVVDLVAIEGFKGRYAWVLANPRQVEPRPVRGNAAIYTVPDAEIVYTGKPPIALPTLTIARKGANASDDDDETMDPRVAKTIATPRSEWGNWAWEDEQ